MRIIALLLLACSPAIAQSPPFQPVATISQIMSAITLPYSDALRLHPAKSTTKRQGLGDAGRCRR